MNKIKSYYKDSLSYYKLAHFLKDYINDSIIICIGTDKCIGDCLGPLIGSSLLEKNFPLPIYGTLEHPIHALNIDIELERIYKLHPYSTIIAIDACLGDIKAIGEIHLKTDSLKPGKGVGKLLPSVGDLSIIGIIDSSSKKDLFSSRAIRLNLVMDISKVIVNALLSAYTLNVDLNN
ncbi:spore protease YyaC [uncultured Clostridium sp.]|uniref:spore protease YyaC n=1 Tax=uncultured Clostridium sp. TaxID=59620 RepID=UPI00260BC9BE|nr:spore protease YyaC [uncultured Clostridium sp.]